VQPEGGRRAAGTVPFSATIPWSADLTLDVAERDDVGVREPPEHPEVEREPHGACLILDFLVSGAPARPRRARGRARAAHGLAGPAPRRAEPRIPGGEDSPVLDHHALDARPTPVRVVLKVGDHSVHLRRRPRRRRHAAGAGSLGARRAERRTLEMGAAMSQDFSRRPARIFRFRFGPDMSNECRVFLLYVLAPPPTTCTVSFHNTPSTAPQSTQRIRPIFGGCKAALSALRAYSRGRLTGCAGLVGLAPKHEKQSRHPPPLSRSVESSRQDDGPSAVSFSTGTAPLCIPSPARGIILNEAEMADTGPRGETNASRGRTAPESTI